MAKQYERILVQLKLFRWAAPVVLTWFLDASSVLLHKYDKIFARKATVCIGLVFGEFCVSYDGANRFFYLNDDLFDDVAFLWINISFEDGHRHARRLLIWILRMFQFIKDWKSHFAEVITIGGPHLHLDPNTENLQRTDS